MLAAKQLFQIVKEVFAFPAYERAMLYRGKFYSGTMVLV